MTFLVLIIVLFIYFTAGLSFAAIAVALDIHKRHKTLWVIVDVCIWPYYAFITNFFILREFLTAKWW